MLFVVSVQFYLQYINDGDRFCDFLAITLYNVYILYQSENLREKLSQKNPTSNAYFTAYITLHILIFSII